jgi:uncharacterized protein (DUF433 family)
MTSEQHTFTPSEAAVVSGLPVRTVQKAIDEGPLARGRRKRRRELTAPDLFYLVTLKSFDPRLVKLTGKAKDELRRSILASLESGKVSTRGLSFGGLVVDFSAVAARVRSSLLKLERARQIVVRDPEILGGEPVIRGTRIPVHLIGDMLEQGAHEEEILSGYPTLKRENLELARIYVSAYPKRGRPPKHPWHTQNLMPLNNVQESDANQPR